MKNYEIKVKLEFTAATQTYTIVRLAGAVSVQTDCTDLNYRVGDTINEKEANSMARRYAVSVVPVMKPKQDQPT